jgi:hypothetical protein
LPELRRALEQIGREGVFTVPVGVVW